MSPFKLCLAYSEWQHLSRIEFESFCMQNMCSAMELKPLLHRQCFF